SDKLFCITYLSVIVYRKFISDHFFLATSVTSEQRFSSDWTSCVICSKTGLFKVLVRAYQTPKTRIKLCWKFANGENSIYRYCAFLRNWKSSDYASKYFTVTPKRPIQVSYHCIGMCLR
ncbi:hypothetical protein WUBG_18633, partial [Wuchereria bancrofti]